MEEKRPLLSVRDLTVRFRVRGRELTAIRGLSLDLFPGESLAVVGESGSGKSVLTKAFCGMLESNGTIAGGQILYREGDRELDLTKLRRNGDWVRLRGSGIAMIFQDPMTSLDPIMPIGRQILSVIRRHQKCSAPEAKRRALSMMEKVGIPEPEKRFRDYPFQYSGGMRQRIVIAIALACRPKILICDEPTTALDVTIQAQILELLKKLNRDSGISMLFISHNLNVVRKLCGRVAVMQRGELVEEGDTEQVFRHPQHPYTQRLIAAIPTRERKEEIR
jgi:oligopeptide transport system ATP-binding protein